MGFPCLNHGFFTLFLLKCERKRKGESMSSNKNGNEQTSSGTFSQRLELVPCSSWSRIRRAYGELAEYAEVTMTLGLLITAIGIVIVLGIQISAGSTISMVATSSTFVSAFDVGMMISTFGAAVSVISAIITMLRH